MMHVNGANTLPSMLAALREKIAAAGSIVVGLSAGVDSSLLAKVAFMELGERAVAVTAVSASLSKRDRMLAAGNAREIGIRHVLLETAEMSSNDYLKNDALRCFHCKAELSTALWSFAGREGFSSVAIGVNATDAGDFRPGIRAAEESGIIFPLRECGIGKEDVRRLARMLSLSSHDRPSNSCLSSRVEYGQRIDERTLRMVEDGEELLHSMGARDVRVRVHGGIARIEVDAGSIPLLMDESRRREIVKRFMEIGFLYVTLDLDGFRSGSMNLKLRSSQ